MLGITFRWVFLVKVTCIFGAMAPSQKNLREKSKIIRCQYKSMSGQKTAKTHRSLQESPKSAAACRTQSF